MTGGPLTGVAPVQHESVIDHIIRDWVGLGGGLAQPSADPDYDLSIAKQANNVSMPARKDEGHPVSHHHAKAMFVKHAPPTGAEEAISEAASWH